MPNIISEHIITAPHIPRSRRVDVEVTPEIIGTATQADSGHCMIADAVKAAVPGAANISVDLQTIRFSDPKKRMRYVYLTPRMAQLALVDFDAGEMPDPFTFRLDRAHIVAMKDPKAPKDPRKSVMTPRKSAAIAKARASRAQERQPAQTPAERRNELKRDQRAVERAGEIRDAGSRIVTHGMEGHVPARVGGPTPPIGPLASGSTGRARKSRKGETPVSRRRQFGLRALERGSEKTVRDKTLRDGA